MLLTAENVEKMMVACLCEEYDETAIVVQGIRNTVRFEAARIFDNASDIAMLLNQLPPQFHRQIGGGWSFLNACFRNDGKQWTGFHSSMENLFLLGIAAGYVKEIFPRDMWSALPGGMPYYVIDIVEAQS